MRLQVGDLSPSFSFGWAVLHVKAGLTLCGWVDMVYRQGAVFLRVFDQVPEDSVTTEDEPVASVPWHEVTLVVRVPPEHQAAAASAAASLFLFDLARNERPAIGFRRRWVRPEGDGWAPADGAKGGDGAAALALPGQQPADCGGHF